MAKNYKKLDKSKNSKNINNIKQNQWIDLELDELEYIVGGGDEVPDDEVFLPPPPRKDKKGNGSTGSGSIALIDNNW